MHRLALVRAKRAFNSGNDDDSEGGGGDEHGVRPYSKCHHEYLSQFENQAILVEIITNSEQNAKRNKNKRAKRKYAKNIFIETNAS